jgi:hypothetical protein
MKKRLGLILMVLLAAVLALSACGGTAEPVVEEAAAPAAEAALTVAGKGYSMADLEGMETMVVESEKKDGTKVEYTGVKVTDLLADAGAAGETVVFVASDGYEAELAFAELEGCADCVVAMDGDALRMVLPGFPGNVQVKGVVEIGTK